jgi:creatinine amidohydrolase
MRFQDLNWMDVERYLETDNRILLITGATEQHAYLSLMTDILIPSRIALAVAARSPILIAPPLNFGVSERFVEYPGTISLSQQTFDSVLSEIVVGLMMHGFQRFFILNGHGGNRLPQRLEELCLDGAIRLIWHDWWRGSAVRAVEAEYGLRLDHANWGENFPFNRVADSPTGEKTLVNFAYESEGDSIRAVLGDGNFGGVYEVDDAIMHSLFEQVVDEAIDLLARL